MDQPGANTEPQTSYVVVTTQKKKTFCHFEDGDSFVVDPNVDHTLKPLLHGQSDILSRTDWRCESVN